MFKPRLTPFQLVAILVFIFVLVYMGTCKCRSESGKESKQLVAEYKRKADSLQKIDDIKNQEFLRYTNGLEKRFNELQTTDSIVAAERNGLKIQISSLIGKSILPKYIYLRNEDSVSSAKLCDSLANEYGIYYRLTARERFIADSLIFVKDSEIANRDSLVSECISQLTYCRQLFKSSIEIEGAFIGAALQQRPRNVLGMTAVGQYNEGTKLFSLGGGLNFDIKQRYSISALVLIDANSNKSFQLQLTKGIHFRK